MAVERLGVVMGTVTADDQWRDVYMIGGIAALIALAGTLTDIAITMIPDWGVASVPDTTQAWFTQFQTNTLLAVRNLDLLNLIIAIIQIPMFLALYGAHRRTNPDYASLALIVVLIGTVVFITNNAALSMLALSQQYVDASTDAQRLTIEAAGVALLAKGAHGSLGVFMGFFLSSLGTLLMGLSMLKGNVFARSTAWVGLVGITLLMVYIISSTFMSDPSVVMMAIALPGGVLMMIWNAMVARELFRLCTVNGR